MYQLDVYLCGDFNFSTQLPEVMSIIINHALGFIAIKNGEVCWIYFRFSLVKIKQTL